MANLIKIGNSQGVRIPKAIIEQAHLSDTELTFKVVNNGLLIQPTKEVRQGWKEQFDKHSEQLCESDREWLDAPLIDDEGYEW